MNEDEARGERLRAALAGKPQAWLADILDCAPSTVNGYLQGKIPPADRAIKIAHTLNVDLEWYISGVAGSSSGGETVQLPILGDMDKALIFPVGLIEMLRLPLEELCSFVVQSSIMAPLIPDGSEVIAWYLKDEIEDGAVYIVNTGKRHILRRVRYNMNDQLVAYADKTNSSFTPEEKISKEQVVARVVWVSHTL